MVHVYDTSFGKGLCTACAEDVGPCEGPPCNNVDGLYVYIGKLRYEKRWYTFWQEMGILHAKKNKDYGEKDQDPYVNFHRAAKVGVEAWRGALVRMMDKVSRIETFATTGQLANESFEDSLMDLAVYCLIVRSLFREVNTAVGDSNYIDPTNLHSLV